MASFWGHVRVTLTWLLPVSLAAVMVVLVVLYAIREVPRVERQPRFISTSPMGVYHTWAAITGAEYCAGTPRRILEMNGTIADVTVASQLCQSVMNPHQCGLGGGFISVYYNHATRKAKAFNAREWAPSAAWSNMFLANSTLSSYGFLAAAVPGELMGYRSMLDSIGSRVPWAELFKDAEALARNGFPVYADLERLLKQNEKVITADEALCEVFCSRLYPQNKTTMVINETLRMPALADTLATIAREGHQAFYGGSVGKMLSDDIRRKGGLITLQDLRSYTVKVDDALRRVLHDNVTVLAPPPPAGGILTAFMLAVMDSYRNPEAPTVKSLPDNDETFHRLVEVTKFAFAGRMEIGDPEHIDISAVVKNISSSSFLSEVRSRIKQYPFWGTGHLSIHWRAAQQRNGRLRESWKGEHFRPRVQRHQLHTAQETTHVFHVAARDNRRRRKRRHGHLVHGCILHLQRTDAGGDAVAVDEPHCQGGHRRPSNSPPTTRSRSSCRGADRPGRSSRPS
ncbi:glutathione hydrolase 1 proenzyme-like isoform X5 [Dermacentor albipictus]|uniref:glutathione hydrolase 1 proenzyme-like isoform X5 n=1 Tax=Dermacentor albipictus TaxID=60249 RepID=UPI0038FBEA3E